jgi:predicted secreted protein
MPSFLKPSWKITFIVKLLLNFLSPIVYIVIAGFTTMSYAQSPEPQNMLRLDAMVSAPITPDTAVITLAAEKSGVDASAVTQTINKLMSDAVAQAKAVSGVEASTGNFSTYQQYDNKGNVNGWTVRSELFLKSKDFGVLGKLAGNLGQSLKIAGSGFEVSRELKAREEAALLQQGLQAFSAKAKAAAQALGFSGYTIREIAIQQAQLEHGNQPRPMMLAMARGAMAEAAPVQLEAGRTAINLTVSGTVQMK